TRLRIVGHGGPARGGRRGGGADPARGHGRRAGRGRDGSGRGRLMRDPVPATPDIANSITDARNEVAAASRQLTDRANDVFRATSAVVVETVEQWVEAFVLGQPDRTQKLGKGGVEKVRADLVAAKAKLPGESAKRLVGAFSWTFPQEAAWIG